MNFSVVTGNHSNSHGIADTVIFLRNALRDCGHESKINESIIHGSCNVMMEHFSDPQHIEALAEGYRSGARYIVIGTEPLLDGIFNGGVVSNHWHYSNTDYWRKRTEGFLGAIRYCEAIWVLAESMVPQYREMIHDKPVIFLPHGHVEGFRRFEHLPEHSKDIDFYGSGTVTEHRERIILALEKRGHRVRFDPSGQADYLRFENLSRSKVCLNLRLSPNNAIPSVSRMHFNIQHANFVAHERYELGCPLDPYVLHLPADEFVEWAEAALDQKDKRQTAEGVLAKFRDEMPMSRLLPPILDASLSHVRRGIAGRSGPSQA